MIGYTEIVESLKRLDPNEARLLGLDVDALRNVGREYAERVMRKVVTYGFQEAVAALFALAYTAGFKAGLGALDVPVKAPSEAADGKSEPQ